MANRIVLKRSSVASKVPLASDLVAGELAVNLTDKLLYTKDAAGNVVTVGDGGGGGGSGTVTGVTATAPVVSSGGTAPVISMAAASTSTPGYLTAADWNTFNGKQSALGFTPYNSTNPNGYISSITSSNVTTALGFTPYNSTNPNGYISSITSSNVTTALGFTPYNSSNPSGYITTSALSSYLPLSGGTLSGNLTVPRIVGVNSLVLNTYTTVNPSSNVFLYSQPNDRDSWIYLDSADTGSNWGIYHRQIDSAVSGLPGNALGFVGGGNSSLKAFISLADGSANFAGALTQAGNQVLHAGNYTSYSPSLTGSGASGTWGINVTGNAATVSNGVYQNTTPTLTGLSFGGNNPHVRLRHLDGKAPSTDTDDVLYLNYSNGQPVTINGYTAYHAGNIPTWNQNTTGNAATSSSISGYNNPTTGATANTIVYRDGSGDIYGRYIFGSYHNSSDDVSTGSITYLMGKFGDNYHRSATAAKVATFLNGTAMVPYSVQGSGNVGGTGSASWHPSGIYSAGYNWLYGGINAGGSSVTNMGDARANIYYDYQDTGWYCDPNSNSRFAGKLYIPQLYINSSNFDDNVSGSSWYGLGGSNIGGAIGGTMMQLASYYGLRIRANSSILELDGPNYGNSWIWANSNFAVGGQNRGTIFYDYSDTGYYCDPNGTSSFSYVTSRTKDRLGTTGNYNTPRSDYTGDSNYWGGQMGWGVTDLNTVNNWGCGFWDSWGNPGNQPAGTSHWDGFNCQHHVSYGWQMAGGAGDPGLTYIRSHWGGGWTQWYKVAIYENNSNANRDFYAGVYYDAANTGYYCVPRSTSRLSTVLADSILCYGTITAYYSDDRLKTRFSNIAGALDKICTLNGFYYEANEVAEKLGYKKKREIGLSAQEVQRILPEIIAPAPADEQYMTIQYDRVVPLLVEAIKELRLELNQLKSLVKL